MKFLCTLFFLILTSCILTHSPLSLYYAFMGLELWYDKMVPTLLPFMILSGIMVRMRLTESFTTPVYPLVRPLFRIRRNVCYGMILGFLCGFPMGARTVSELLVRQQITKREGEYLLAFCNNIGPVYFLGFVIPLLHRQLLLPYLFGMYGIPLLYGLLLRYTVFRDLDESFQAVKVMKPMGKTFSENSAPIRHTTPEQLLAVIDESISASGYSILMLGGYMILFNLLNLLPHLFLGKEPEILAPLLEISGGLRLLGDSCPLYTLLLLPFGGFSCIAQTYSCIRNTDLSLADYILHKLILSFFTGLYYLGWFLFFPASFLR